MLWEQQDTLRRTNDELEARVLERTAALAQTNAQLEEARVAAEAANLVKSEFLANMSHELRTPLSAVIGFSEGLREVAEEEGLGLFVTRLQKIETAGRHLLELINGVLDLSKVEAGKMDLFVETFAVRDVLEDVAATIQPLVAQNDNTLQVECGDDLGAMRGDLTKVRQVLLNLLSNATKFTEHGTVTLAATRGAVGRIVVRVSDMGIGMTPQQMDKLFQPFVQADASTTRKYGGTGLGLALSRRFCELMGAEITAESESGRGTTFTVDFPEQLSDGLELPPPSVSSARASGPTVLVIDDDPVAQDLMKEYLAREGYAAVSASSGEEGLRLARALRPLVITLDVLMPDMDGWAVLFALKADPELSDIPVVMLTMTDEKRLGFTLGASDYLTKPVDRGRLNATLRRFRTSAAAPVLVVDDDDASRAFLRDALERDGWSVEEAENGRVALERVAAQRPAVVLLDLMMPEMDGFEFLARARATEAYRDVPIVVVTARELSREDRTRLLGAVSAVFQKETFGPSDLLRQVRGLIEERATAPHAPVTAGGSDRGETPAPAGD